MFTMAFMSLNFFNMSHTTTSKVGKKKRFSTIFSSTMHEHILVSLSAQANHLTTHFYNAQSSYFVYDTEDVNKKSFVDPHILFRPGVSTDGKTPTFTPRALLWEMRGGFGSLKKSNAWYNYDSQDVPLDIWQGSKPNEEIKKIEQTAVPVSEYQQALDQGTAKPDLLTKENTKYWSDYVNIFFNPKLSFHSLPDWEYDPDTAPLGNIRGETGEDARHFVNFETGKSEYQEVNSLGHDGTYVEDTLRPLIEEADRLDGITFSTEVDTAWGGFTAQMLEEFRQDYATKTTIFTWGFYDEHLPAGLYSCDRSRLDRKNALQVISRIKSTIALANESSLLVPISKPLKVPMEGFDLSSNWHSNALMAIPFESFNVLPSLRNDKRVPMQHILDTLQGGSKRNVVSMLDCSIIHPSNNEKMDPLQKLLNFGKPNVNSVDFDLKGSLFESTSKKESKVFSKVGVLRRPPGYDSPGNLSGMLNQVDPDILQWETFFKKSQLLSDGTPETNLKRFDCPQPFATPMSYPADALELDGTKDSVYASMGMSTEVRKCFKVFHKVLNKYTRSTDDGIEELKEDVLTLAEQYEWGWNSDDEDDFFEDE